MQLKKYTNLVMFLYIGAAFALVLFGKGNTAYSIMGGVVALFGFVMVLLAQQTQIIRIMKQQGTWQEEMIKKPKKVDKSKERSASELKDEKDA